VAMAPAEFDRWLRAEAAPARAPTGANAERGRAVFDEARCAACHQVRDSAAPADGEVARGPDLTHIGGRVAIGAGVLAMHRDTAARWVAEVQQLKPGARMPSYEHLDRDSLAALGSYLEALK
jgi:cytochrome c oxidase subunit II